VFAVGDFSAGLRRRLFGLVQIGVPFEPPFSQQDIIEKMVGAVRFELTTF